MSKRFRASYTIAFVFVTLALLAVYGYRYANDFLLGREKFPPLRPATVNIVGVDTKAGYHIIVENSIAKLVIGAVGSFTGPEMDDKARDSDAVKKFIPIKDMLLGLSGDQAHLAIFVQRLNDITDNDLIARAPVWKIEEIEAALQGKQPYHDKLVHDLNMNLDGTPLDRVSRSALFNGITIDAPVAIRIDDGYQKKTVEARVHQPYRPGFLSGVENRLKEKFVTNELIATQYAAAAKALGEPGNTRENIAERLRQIGKSADGMAETPQRILDSVQIVLNENQITGARYTKSESAKGTIYALVITLNDEGRKRLWQFSRDRVGDQLLLTVDGVAIAAPRIEHGISSGEIEISGLADESLVQDAVAKINNKAKSNP